MSEEEMGKYWSLTPDQLLEALASNSEGLDSTAARQRLQEHGLNLLESREKVTPFGLFLNQFKSPIILILLFATGVSFVVQEWVDALIILLIILGSAILSFLQEYNAHNASEKLKSQLILKATVLREGKRNQ